MEKREGESETETEKRQGHMGSSQNLDCNRVNPEPISQTEASREAGLFPVFLAEIASVHYWGLMKSFIMGCHSLLSQC